MWSISEIVNGERRVNRACLVLSGSVRHFDVALLATYEREVLVYFVASILCRGNLPAFFTTTTEARLWQLNYYLSLWFTQMCLCRFYFPLLLRLQMGRVKPLLVFFLFVRVRARLRTNRSVPLVLVVPLKPFQKIGFPEQAVGSFTNGFSGLSRNGPRAVSICPCSGPSPITPDNARMDYSNIGIKIAL